MNRAAAAAVGAAAAFAVTAAPASASVDGWHDGTTVWAGMYPTRADLYTVAGYADTWRIQYEYSTYGHAEYGWLRLWTDGTLRTSWKGWVPGGPSNNGINWHTWRYTHTARLCVTFPYHSYVSTCAYAYR